MQTTAKAAAATAAKEAKAEASAIAEAAAHVVPPPPCLGELMEAKLSLNKDKKAAARS